MHYGITHSINLAQELTILFRDSLFGDKLLYILVASSSTFNPMSLTFMAAISVAISTDIWIAYNSDPAPGQPVKEEVGDSGKEGGSKFKKADLS
ncbi:hypothetical protein ig2599ANME_2031 [groundwater metagenome]